MAEQVNISEAVESLTEYLISKRNPRERTMLNMRRDWGLTYKEIGTHFDISASRVQQILANPRTALWLTEVRPGFASERDLDVGLAWARRYSRKERSEVGSPEYFYERERFGENSVVRQWLNG